MEVIIPTEIGISTAKTAMKDQMDNDEELIKQLDWAYEKRGAAAIWIAFLPSMGNRWVQQKGTTMIFPARIFCPQKSLQKHCWSGSRKATS